MPRFRFSLLSLICFVLLLASAGALWWNWEAWEPTCVISGKEPIQHVSFSSDDRFIMLRSRSDSYCEMVNAQKRAPETFSLHDAATGRLITSKDVFRPLLSITFSPGAQYIFLTHMADGGIWSTETGEPLPGFQPLQGHWSISVISPNDHFAQITANDFEQFNQGKRGFSLVRLPSFETIQVFDGKMECWGFSPDEKWLIMVDDEKFQLVSTQTGAVAHTFPRTSLCPRYAFSHSGALFAVEEEIASPDEDKFPNRTVTHVYDIASEALLSEFNGTPALGAFTPDDRSVVVGLHLGEEIQATLGEIGSTTPARLIGEIRSLDVPRGQSRFRAGTLLFDNPFKAVDLRTCTTLYDNEMGNYAIEIFNNQELACVSHNRKKSTINRTSDGSVSLDPYRVRWRGFTPTKDLEYNFAGAHHQPMFAIASSPAENQTTIWRLTKPSLPWDALKMPEFWLTLLFAAVLIRQLFRRARFLNHQ